MALLHDTYSVNQILSQISMLLIATLVKGFFIFAIVRLFVVKARGLSPAHRHLFWFFTVVICLLIPPLSLISLPLRVVGSPLFEAQSKTLRALSNVVSQKVLTIENPLQPVATYHSFMAQGVMRSAAASAAVTAGEWRLPRLSFACWAVFAWAAGAAFFLSSILVGVVKLRKLIQKARPPEVPFFSRALKSLVSGAAWERKVRILTSCRCNVPFTCGVFRPVILFPSVSIHWPEEWLRAVLIHELTHVRRMDYLTQLVSRTVCALLWFAPHLWVAHSRLHMEQEKAADAFTVRAGTRPSEYACYLLEFARILKQPDPLLTGFLSPGNRKSSLEKRVVAIMRMRSGAGHSRAVHFFRLFVFCLLCALPLLLLNPLSGGANRAPAVSKSLESGAASLQDASGGDTSVRRVPVDPAEAFESIAGSWINEEYENICKTSYRKGQKFVMKVDGSAELWSRSDAMGPCCRLYYEIEKSWIGSDGCLYCQARRKRRSSSPCISTELWRLDQFGMLLELVFINGTQDEFPDRIDPSLAAASHIHYWIYYRGEEDAQSSKQVLEDEVRPDGTFAGGPPPVQDA